VLAAWAVARARQRLEGPPPRPRAPGCRPGLAAYSALCLAGGGLLACHLVLTRHDPPIHPHPVAQTIAAQSIRCGRLPGFWLPDQFGNRVRLADFEGKRLVVGFWSPAEPDSVGLLGVLQHITEEHESAGDVRVVAVCLADDTGIARRFALERGYRFPMVTDTGTHWAAKVVDSSPLAEAYEVDSLPQVFVADHNRDLVAGSGLMPAAQVGAFIQRNLAVAAGRP
jgi:peroxiredoxin